jgi:hypothetical protein
MANLSVTAGGVQYASLSRRLRRISIRTSVIIISIDRAWGTTAFFCPSFFRQPCPVIPPGNLISLYNAFLLRPAILGSFPSALPINPLSYRNLCRPEGLLKKKAPGIEDLDECSPAPLTVQAAAECPPFLTKPASP